VLSRLVVGAAAALVLAAPAMAAPAPRPASPAAAGETSLSAEQLEAAGRVFTGIARCEFGRRVAVEPVAGKPGHFVLRQRGAVHDLVPEPTTTGAVRLEDRRRGLVWLQIPSKSMLLDSRRGRRVLDGCRMPQQERWPHVAPQGSVSSWPS
jgi:hypothetical protein